MAGQKQIQGQQDAFRRNIELSERDKYNLDGLIGGVFSRGEITEENKENIFCLGFGEGRVVEGAGQSRRFFLSLERRTFL